MASRTDSGPYAGVEQRLDLAVRLLASLLTKGMTRKEAILTLSGAGLPPKDVASILGISGNQVSVALYDAKHSAAKKAKPSPKKG
jgi:DNA-directed RNA polymerase specialized sigma24 family protein